MLRAASHPATWAEPAAAAAGPAVGEAVAAVEAGAGAAGSSGSLWDALAGSAGLCMRPQLVLMLSALLPVEARLAYLGLRHAAYAGPGGRGGSGCGGAASRLGGTRERAACSPCQP